MNDKLLQIPKKGKTYDDLDLVHVPEGYFSAYKKVGFTPLQALEEVRKESNHIGPMTYVGRLDPMAEGWFDVLFNGDMELKEKLMQKDKKYEVEVLLGISTDTGDVLGKIETVEARNISLDDIKNSLQKFVGKFTWEYPAFSSPMLGKGPDQVKKKDIEIYSVEFLKERSINAEEVLKEVLEKLESSRMPGDFRLPEIKRGWKELFPEFEFKICTIQVHCSSGTYMRILAEKWGTELDVPAVAFSIKRL